MADTETVQLGRALFGTGRLPAADWSAFAAAFPEATAVWADLERMQPEKLPEATTHLWFWRVGREGRVRIDGSSWVAGVLAGENDSLPAACRLADTGLVVDVTQLRPWADEGGPAKQRKGDAAAWEPLAQLVPQRAGTAVFLTDPALLGIYGSH